MPQRYGVYKLIINSLQKLGFEVIDVTFQDEFFKYKNLGERIRNIFQKIAGNKDYKQILKFEHQKKYIEERLLKLDTPIDYALIIRADLYPHHILRLIRNKSKKTTGYQWDGMNVFPSINDRIKYFDKFYVFDPNDVVEEKKGITNFHFEKDIVQLEKYPFNNENYKNIYDIYFLGIYSEKRMPYIVEFIKKIENLSIKARIEILSPNSHIDPRYNLPQFFYINHQLSYSEVCSRNKFAKILIDFVDPKHHGLSFRVFEALADNKKLITSNVNIKYYEFYNPANILIYTDKTTPEEITNFINTPYQINGNKIIEKYSFKNWIANILDFGEYQKIDLPSIS